MLSTSLVQGEQRISFTPDAHAHNEVCEQPWWLAAGVFSCDLKTTCGGRDKQAGVQGQKDKA